MSPKNLERHIEEKHLGMVPQVPDVRTLNTEEKPNQTYRQHLPYVDEKQIAEAQRAEIEEKRIAAYHSGSVRGPSKATAAAQLAAAAAYQAAAHMATSQQRD